jgi:ADP-ribose pyrophosphatase YjhB (NUDIX family)
VIAMHRTDYLGDPDAPQANSIVIATSAYVTADAGRILLILRTDNDLWSIPGGGMEIGETVTDCVIRETKEETGLDIETTGLVGIFTNPDHVVAYPDGEVRQQFSICLRGRAVGGEIASSNESREVHWVDRDQLDALAIHPEIRRRIDRGALDDPTPWVD